MHAISRHLTHKRGRKKMETAKPHFSRRTQTFPINNSKGNNRPPAYPPPTPFRPEKKRRERKKKQNKNTTQQRVSKSVTQLRDKRAYLPRGESAGTNARNSRRFFAPRSSPTFPSLLNVPRDTLKPRLIIPEELWKSKPEGETREREKSEK